MKDLIGSADIPAMLDLKKLTDFEEDDQRKRDFISFWEYCAVLAEFKENDRIDRRRKAVLNILYVFNEPLSMVKVNKLADEKHPIVVQGDKGLGGLASRFNEKFEEMFGRKITVFSGVASELFLDYIKPDPKDAPQDGTEKEVLYVVLKSRFRAALAKVFGDNEIRNW